MTMILGPKGEEKTSTMTKPWATSVNPSAKSSGETDPEGSYDPIGAMEEELKKLQDMKAESLSFAERQKMRALQKKLEAAKGTGEAGETASSQLNGNGGHQPAARFVG